MVVRHFVPPSSSSREAVLALAAANKYRWRIMASEGYTTSSEEELGPRGIDSNQIHGREMENREAFPIGYRGHTHLEDGWVDLASGPSLSLAIGYMGRAHHPNPALPNSLQVDIDAPTVLLRVFGFLVTDLLALKVSSTLLVPCTCVLNYYSNIITSPPCVHTRPQLVVTLLHVSTDHCRKTILENT